MVRSVYDIVLGFVMPVEFALCSCKLIRGQDQSEPLASAYLQANNSRYMLEAS